MLDSLSRLQLPSETDTKMKLIEEVRKSGRIPGSLYTKYVEGCDKEKKTLLEGESSTVEIIVSGNRDRLMRIWPSGKLTFERQKIAKNLTFFSKKLTKIVIFFNKIEKKCQVFGNFLTVKCQFSGGSDPHLDVGNSSIKTRPIHSFLLKESFN